MYPIDVFRWMRNMKSTNKRSNISAIQFYPYRFSIRNGFKPFLNLGKLTQQYMSTHGSKLKVQDYFS